MSKQYFTVDEWKEYGKQGNKNFVKGNDYKIELKTFWNSGRGERYAKQTAKFLGFCSMEYAGIQKVVFGKFQIGQTVKYLRLFPNFRSTSYVAVFGLGERNYSVIDVAQ